MLPRFILTARDVGVVEWVHQLRYLTVDQIQRLEYPKPSARSWCQERLKRLYHYGYLDRVYKPIAPGQGSSPAIYVLDKKGRDLIAAEREITKAEVGWERGADLDKALLFLDHSLAINDIRISFILACKHMGYKLNWIDERTLRGANMPDYVEDTYGGRVPIVADGHLTVCLPDGRRASHFLELDRGRQDVQQFRRKVRGHTTYANSGQYEQRYSTRSLRVLIITTAGERRLEELKRWTEAEGGGDLFWFTTIERATPDSILTQAIWQAAGQEGTQALLS